MVNIQSHTIQNSNQKPAGPNSFHKKFSQLPTSAHPRSAAVAPPGPSPIQECWDLLGPTKKFQWLNVSDHSTLPFENTGAQKKTIAQNYVSHAAKAFVPGQWPNRSAGTQHIRALSSSPITQAFGCSSPLNPGHVGETQCLKGPQDNAIFKTRKIWQFRGQNHFAPKFQGM